jgi:hypothetical protein
MLLLGYDVDVLSTIPAIFATLLSLYNWYLLRKPAKIIPNEIISYGFIASEFHGGYQFCVPLIFHNSGYNFGLITDVKIGFKTENGFKYLENLGKANLLEVDVNTVFSFDWDSFEKEGYRMILPTYPIEVEGQSSCEVTFILQASQDEKVLPIDTETTCIIEIKYGNNRTSTTEFPFYLSSEFAEVDNSLRWYEPIQK